MWECACPAGSLHFARGGGTAVCGGGRQFRGFAELDDHEQTLLTGLSCADYQIAKRKVQRALAAKRTEAAHAASAGASAGAGAAAPPS